MILLAYGVVAGDTPLSDVIGVGGRPLESLAVEDLGVMFSVADVPAPQPDPDTAVAYGLALESIHATRTIVPFRYGALAADLGRLTALVRVRAGWFRAALERLDGFTEVTLRVTLDAVAERALAALSGTGPVAVNEPTLVSAGAEYLRRRKAVFAARGVGSAGLSAARELLRATVPVARAWKAERVAHPEPALAVHALIPRGAVTDFQDAVTAQPLFTGLRWVVTGPWPPFNFVGTTSTGDL